MPFQLIYRPEQLSFRDFTKVETDCFPDEAFGMHAFQAMKTRDFWAVFVESRFVGYGYLSLESGVAWIKRVAVSREFRRKGIGRALVETLVEQCSKSDFAEVILYAQKDNEAALALYGSLGFAPVESSYQFVAPIARIVSRHRSHEAAGLEIVPVTQLQDVAELRLPKQWANLADMHDPPRQHVFVFQKKCATIGYCRLNPAFPGCFPFVLKDHALLPCILAALGPYLNPDYESLKLTLSDDSLAEACRGLGCRLNYELLKMAKKCG